MVGGRDTQTILFRYRCTCVEHTCTIRTALHTGTRTGKRKRRGKERKKGRAEGCEDEDACALLTAPETGWNGAERGSVLHKERERDGEFSD